MLALATEGPPSDPPGCTGDRLDEVKGCPVVPQGGILEPVHVTGRQGGPDGPGFHSLKAENADHVSATSQTFLPDEVVESSVNGGIDRLIINLTPHTVNLIREDGSVVAFESQGIARADQQVEEAGIVDGVRIVRTTYGAPVDLPEPAEGVLYIVSSLTVSSARAVGRTVTDLLTPVESVRDGQGKIIGCKALAIAG